jgi:hypothetical protein
MKKRFSHKTAALLLCGLSIIYGAYLSTRDMSDLPPLQNGDLIFQTSWTDQSIAIGLATGSLYIHTGIIKENGDGFSVIDAGRVVRETPLKSWIEGGILKRFSVYRYRGLSKDKAAAIITAAESHYGKPYDHYFSFDNEAIYCSELPYLAFKAAGLNLGEAEKIGSLYINNTFVKKLIEQRWERYPACQGKELSFEQCYGVIMSQPLISPESLAADKNLERIFTNYQ